MDDSSGGPTPISEPRVIYERGGVLVVAKPAGMHCAPGDEMGTLCSWVFGARPAAGMVRGRDKGEGGLLHRLDSATSGLVAFALDDASFAAMSACAASGRFMKTYEAICEVSMAGLSGSLPERGFPDGVDPAIWAECLRAGPRGPKSVPSMLSGAKLRCRFRPYGPGASRVACASPSATLGKAGAARWTEAIYESSVGRVAEIAGRLVAEVTLSRGFRHQIRAQMAWLGLPLIGDPLYGEGEGQLGLSANRVEFDAPDGSGRIVVNLP